MQALFRSSPGCIESKQRMRTTEITYACKSRHRTPSAMFGRKFSPKKLTLNWKTQSDICLETSSIYSEWAAGKERPERCETVT